MKLFIDILLRTLYMSFFILIIPIGAYTIHNGSSAIVALVSYLVLSILIPFWYLGSQRSGFGPKQYRIQRWCYIVAWLLVQAVTYKIFFGLEFSFFWSLPSMGRDVGFIIGMYLQVVFSLWVGYGLTQIFGPRRQGGTYES